jgi:hypothetical protein
MVAFAVLISFLFQVQTRNQSVLVEVGKQVPHVIFLLFLVNASVLEEVYRQLLWEKLIFFHKRGLAFLFSFPWSHSVRELAHR